MYFMCWLGVPNKQTCSIIARDSRVFSDESFDAFNIYLVIAMSESGTFISLNPDAIAIFDDTFHEILML